MQGRATFDNVDELFALGIASAKLGDGVRAEAALDQMGKAIEAAPDSDNRQLAEIMRLELIGVMKSEAGDRTAALESLERAARLETSRPRPNARPYPIKPAVELYAETLLTSGNPRAAVSQFQVSLGRTPRRAASLSGLALAASAAGLRTQARQAAQEFLDMWRRADADRPEIVKVRAILTRR